MHCLKKMLQNYFIKNLAGTENLTSNTEYRTTIGKTKELSRQLYKPPLC